MAIDPAPAEQHLIWEDGPLDDMRRPTTRTTAIAEARSGAKSSTRMPGSPTACGPPARRRRRSNPPRAAPARRSIEALSLAYDFAIAALENPEEYAELLEESGVKAQARAPMTPIVKLVFGMDYDKARLTEFAAALSYAQRRQVGLGGFQELIEKQPGGLKALVAAEREARRPEPKPDTRGEAARARLRAARRCRWPRCLPTKSSRW